MFARHFLRATFFTSWFLVFSVVANSQDSIPTSLTTEGGLQTATFETRLGVIRVYLPDDMRSGETISGSIAVAPKGTDSAEREVNARQLARYLVGIGSATATTDTPQFKWILPKSPTQPLTYRLALWEVAPDQTRVELTGIRLLPSGAAVTPDPTGTKLVQPIGQVSRPVPIIGGFDGNSDNTKVSVGGQPVRILAESPRKAVFRAPNNVIGSTTVTINEGATQASSPFRNVGINLSAPKTNLLKGEKTVVTIEVIGLEGIKTPLDLQLKASNEISMAGGNEQKVQITPTEVAGARYTTSREITGVLSGGFNMVATVTAPKP